MQDQAEARCDRIGGGMVTDRCPTCRRKVKRTNEANRYLWLLLHTIAEKITPNGEQYSAEAFHEYFKQRLLGAEEIKMPNGKVWLRSHSTADLDKSEFQDYVQQIEAWAAERGVYVDDMVSA